MFFPELTYEEKEELWNKMLELATQSGDILINEQTVRALGMFFSEIPDEMRDKALERHNQAYRKRE
jgi:hypothetical protein